MLSQLVPGSPTTTAFVRDVVHASEGRMYFQGGLVHLQPSEWHQRGAAEAARFDAFGKGTGKRKLGARARGKGGPKPASTDGGLDRRPCGGNF